MNTNEIIRTMQAVPRADAAAALPPLDDEAFARIAKALGHPARVAIVRHLVAEGRCVCGRIVDILPLAQSTVSQHLKVLKEAGVLLGEVEGPRICYCVDRDLLARFAACAAAFPLRPDEYPGGSPDDAPQQGRRE
ncbi:putative transcriptional regulator, ArsR family [Desulfovibrio sp. X2]|uniref:ArsR/SmtB family transcription factor n=1 Tax=Desulfovibrio sp. X2 TaxID=941449 RepID=UPI000358B3E4|nr:metalloregulator ArsR/SmtB family transcription factor [Desulfovibrio sp. X2]EPR42825.1 putative transcriptional regulator, ArsR family [Desulfovibrio sp. X2]